MKSLFDFQETLEVVTNGVEELAVDATETQRTSHKDSKAFYCIQVAVDGENFERIAHVESAKEAWDVLFKYYEGGEKVKSVKLQSLCMQYELLQMGETKKVATYVSKVHNLVLLMKGCSETMTNRAIIEKVMKTLASHFDHVIVEIQEDNNLSTMKLEDLVGSLEAHEMQIIEIKGVQEAIRALQPQTW